VLDKCTAINAVSSLHVISALLPTLRSHDAAAICTDYCDVQAASQIQGSALTPRSASRAQSKNSVVHALDRGANESVRDAATVRCHVVLAICTVWTAHARA
jgi:hypothetical protein